MTLGRVGEKKLGLWGRLKRVMLTDVGALVRGLKAADLEEIEQLLIEADFGVPATMELVDALEQGVRSGKLKKEDDVREALIERLSAMLRGPEHPERIARATSGLTVILVVGVNGVGKTTTVAKLAKRLKGEGTEGPARGRRYLACRCGVAAAGLGSSAIGVECVAGTQGGDPAAVAFDAIEAATARGLDTVIIDTAGRLHTQDNLMDELKKVMRVVTRKVPGAPHETLLVLDGTVGQNAIQQGRLFGEAVQPTGVIVTKLDGTARGGAVAALRRELGVPIRFVGVGEGVDDLAPFDARAYAEGLL